MNYLLVLSLFAASTDAFVPATKCIGVAQSSTTSLKFGFLKELGLEKPAWLPDFGGEKSKAPAEPVATVAEVEEDGEEEAAPATDEITP